MKVNCTASMLVSNLSASENKVLKCPHLCGLYYRCSVFRKVATASYRINKQFCNIQNISQSDDTWAYTYHKQCDHET